MNTQNAMEEVSVEQLIAKYNLIVPEIQREYVWGNNDFQILDTFILDIIEGYKENENSKNNPNQEYLMLQKMYEGTNDLATKENIKKLLDGLIQNHYMNIGFLYSYRPDYYVYNDRNEDVYLIDGQQRFTTLFLTLFYFAIKENRQSDFELLFRFDKDLEHIAFDYRVRTLTHNFVIDLLSQTKTMNDLLKLEKKNWFLSNYGNDVTVLSIVGRPNDKNEESGTFRILHKYFKDDNNTYYDFIKKHIKFWHFKTEETSQGEELYITMNSRGQQLADNETIRAKLFETDEVKNNQTYWSERWEEWQDFFWKHRDKLNSEATADKGFNEFLRWVQIIKMIETQANESDIDEDSANNKDILQTIRWNGHKKLNCIYLSLSEIDIHFKAVKYLFTEFKIQLKNIQNLYRRYKSFDLIDSNWLQPKGDSIEQIDCFGFLPVLYYCKKFQPYETEQTQNLFRFVRFLHNLKKDKTVTRIPSQSCINAVKIVMRLPSNDICSVLTEKGISTTLLNTEERWKLSIYSKIDKRDLFEDAFWRAEDIKINDGEISHLIHLCNEESKKESIGFIRNFVLILNSYIELTENEKDIWGNLLNSSVYFENSSRVAVYWGYWHKNIDFLQMVVRGKNFDGNLGEFLINEQKTFINSYENKEAIQNEESLKKQLYIYYILQRNISDKWNIWSERWNFGVYNPEENTDLSWMLSLFKKKRIFQSYPQRWMYNLSYILWIHQHSNRGKDYLQELIDWANS